VSLNVKAFYCSEEFGNPSGHSQTALCLSLAPCLDVLANQMKNSAQWKKSLLIASVVIYSLSIGYSRLFLGAHSINQVIYGYSLGAWVAFSFNYIVKDDFLDHIDKLISCEKV